MAERGFGWGHRPWPGRTEVERRAAAAEAEREAAAAEREAEREAAAAASAAAKRRAEFAMGQAQSARRNRRAAESVSLEGAARLAHESFRAAAFPLPDWDDLEPPMRRPWYEVARALHGYYQGAA